MRPMRSPRMMRVEKSRTTGLRRRTPCRRLRLRTPAGPTTRRCSTCRRTDADRLAPRRALVAASPCSARTRPSFARPPRLDALAQPHFLLGQPLVELLLPDRLVGEPLVLLAEERRVVARPRRQPAAIELDDARREPLEERAIVRDEDDGAGVLGQKRLEPRDRVDVEMVGRLVEQQQVGLRPPARAPAARGAASRPTACRRWRRPAGSRLREHQLDALLDAPAVALLELVLQPAERLEQRRRAASATRATAAW